MSLNESLLLMEANIKARSIFVIQTDGEYFRPFIIPNGQWLSPVSPG